MVFRAKGEREIKKDKIRRNEYRKEIERKLLEWGILCSKEVCTPLKGRGQKESLCCHTGLLLCSISILNLGPEYDSHTETPRLGLNNIIMT
jgi:hypothetical protein